MRALVLALALFAGCAARSYEHQSAAVHESYDGAYPAAAYEELARAPASAGRGGDRAKDAYPPPPPPPPPPPSAAYAPPAEPEPAPEVAPADEAADRLVHYEGYARLRATDPEAVVDSIAGLARDLGGRVERMTGAMVSVRVPVGSFEETYARILALGDILDRSVRADDVTDQFLAVDLRVRTLRATRDRLIALLAKATQEEEKLALLQQITRVTEELDAVEATLRTLADLAALSRITVEVEPRRAFAGAGGPEVSGFGWLTSISPFDRSVWSDKRLALPVPDGLVALAPKGPFIAESPDGTVLWTDRVENDPVGDGRFWTAALVERVGDEFTNVGERAVGGWSCVSLDEAGADEPYRWQVCVMAAGRWLHVAQAWFPGPAQVERYGADVDASIASTGGGA